MDVLMVRCDQSKVVENAKAIAKMILSIVLLIQSFKCATNISRNR
jgi:hypothetical protein